MSRRALALSLTASLAAGVPSVGRKLPDLAISEGGLLTPRTKVVDGRMVLDGKEVGRRPWRLSESTGRVRTVYHLAARMGVDDLNKAYIDALIAAKLPETAPDGAYKTLTILDLSDALWGTVGLGERRLSDSQRDFPYALHVLDPKGVARAAWGLAPKTSTVIVLDRDDTVLFAKEGKLSPDEVRQAVALIQKALAKR